MVSVCRRGTDPPMNEAGTTGAISSLDRSCRRVSAGNGCCIAAQTISNCGPGTSWRSNWHIRSLCSSAAMMGSTPQFSWPSLRTTIGNSGQTSSVFLTGVLALQWSRRLRRRGDPKTIFRHFRHTWTSVCHASICSSSSESLKSNIFSSATSGSVSMVTRAASRQSTGSVGSYEKDARTSASFIKFLPSPMMFLLSRQ